MWRLLCERPAVTGLRSSDKSLGEGRQDRISLTCSSAENPGQGPSFNFCLLGEGQPDFSRQTKNQHPWPEGLDKLGIWGTYYEENQGNSPFQNAFPPFKFLCNQHESPYFPGWELSVCLQKREVLLHWRGADQAWIPGTLPLPSFLTSLFRLSSKDQSHSEMFN